MVTRGKNRDRREVDPANTTGKSIEINRRSCAQGLFEVSALIVVVQIAATISGSNRITLMVRSTTNRSTKLTPDA